jgi:subtilisin family serine protease
VRGDPITRTHGPFGAFYPQPDPPATQDEAEQIEKHAEHLASGDKQYFIDLIDFLNRRRSGEDRMDLVREPDDRDFGLLQRQGELIVRTELVDESLLAELRDAIVGFEENARLPVPDELEGKVTRFASTLEAKDLHALARRLRADGHAVSVNHFTPLNPWVKGKGGPEPTRRRPELVAGKPVASTVVAVIDTGISDIRNDGWLDEIQRAADRSNVDELMRPGDTFLALGAGHGTFTCGLVTQASRMEIDGEVRPAAPIVAIKALDVDGLGSEIEVAAAMVRAVHDGARIINLSLGTQSLDDQPPVALQVALEIIDAYDGPHGPGQEVVIVAAAGNYGDTRPCWPAAFKRVVAVAGLTGAGTPAVWSSRGFWVDCSTVGQGLVSTFVIGDESPEIDPEDADVFPPGSDWAGWLGTSFAAPQIAGLIARLCAERELTPRQALGEILRSGHPVPDFGKAVTILPGT